MPIKPPFDLAAKFRALSLALRGTFDAESVGGVHSYEKGMRRENILHEFLARHLPPRFGVGRGEIMDSNGWSSDQIDLVIYDALHSPLLQGSAASRIFPAESTYAAIEVKAVLDPGELDAAADTITSAKRLDRSAIITEHDGHSLYHGPRENPGPFTAIFAFHSGTKPEALARALSARHQKCVPDAWLDCICLFDTALIYHFAATDRPDDTRLWTPTFVDEEAFVGYYESWEDTLLLFYLFLLHQLNARSLFPPDLIRYAHLATLDVEPHIVGPNIALPPDPGEEP